MGKPAPDTAAAQPRLKQIASRDRINNLCKTIAQKMTSFRRPIVARLPMEY